ncbi:MAG: protein kinase [Pseudomonadota bacterium]
MAESRFGSYVLGKRIAVGGMAEIFEAQRVGPEGFQKPVAIKRILPSFDTRPEFRTMFTHEARIAAQLNHPNIVQVYDFGETDEGFFIAMEYVPGTDLSKILAVQHTDGIRMPSVLAVFIVREILHALQYAHTRKDASGRLSPIVHRDVSPPNVLVSYEGKVKLTDFGIAKALRGQERTTHPGAFKGKIHYASPEQLRGEASDVRSDLFSTGILLYLLLTGRRPFDGKDPYSILQQQMRERYRSFKPKALRISDELTKVIHRSLKPDPADRFQRTEEFIGHLEPHLEGQTDHQLEERLTSYLAHLFKGTVREMVAPAEEALATTDPEMSAGGFSIPTHVPDDFGVKVRGRRPSLIRATFFGLICALLGYAGYYAWTWYREQTHPPDIVSRFAAPTPTRAAQPAPTVVPARPALADRVPAATAVPLVSATVAPPPRRVEPTKFAPRPEKKLQTTAKVLRPAQAVGSLTVFPDGPFATVYLDGKKLGDTPILKRQVPAGHHRLSFENEKLGRKNEVWVDVEKGKETRLQQIWKEGSSP